MESPDVYLLLNVYWYEIVEKLHTLFKTVIAAQTFGGAVSF